MKKILSILLCATMLLGFTAIAANAAETKDIPSRSSYKEEFISELINSEDEWLDDSLKQSGTLQFIDFNFDGKLEFIVKKTGSSANNYTKLYYLDGSSVKCAEIKSGWMSDKYEAYYDKNNKEYRMFGAYSFHTNGDTYYYETQNVEIKFNGNKVESEFYSGLRYNGVNYGEDEKNFVYYNEQKEEIIKDEYYSINSSQLKNCVNANMLYDSAECSNYCTYPQMKKDTLSKLYDSFYYYKYDASDRDTDMSTDKPTVKDYTATDLVNKSLSEIVDIMGGEYEIKGEYGQVYIANDIIPGMSFFTSLTIKEDTHYGYPTSSEEKEIRNAINNGKASLAYIDIYGDAKFDKNITANMTYNELTKCIGRFDCYYDGTRLYPGYDLYDDGGKQVAFFAFPQNTIGFVDDKEAMKNINPKLSSIAVFPGYDSSMLYADTDSDTVSKTYTAEELINKTVPEIIDIMGGNFQFCKKGFSDYIPMLFAFYNTETLPGFLFVIDGLEYSEFEKSKDSVLTEIRSGKYNMYCISITGKGKLDNNISADMRYNDLTRYYGNFDCVFAGGAGNICADLKVEKLSIIFRSEDVDFSKYNTGISANELKSVNPRIKEINVYSGYAPLISGSDTDSQSDTDSASSTNNSSKTSSTKTTATGGTTNNANGKPSGGVVSTGVATGISLGVALMAVSCIIVLLAKKRKKS